MTIPSSSSNLACSLLETEISHCKNLYDLLQQEYTLLQGNNSDQLEELINLKQKVIIDLESSIAEHNRLLLDMGFVTDPSVLLEYMENLTESSRQKTLWDTLQNLITDCKKQNDINSSVITLCRRQISNTLELFYSISGRENTYGPSGESHTTRLSNSLGKA